MAFFDNIGKKASESTAKAVQKAKDLSEIAKLNAQISDEQKRITGIYQQIGQMYRQLHEKDAEQDFAALLHNIEEAEAHMKECQNQIQELKGVVRCEKCGAELPWGSAFCSSCGAPIPQPEPEQAADADAADADKAEPSDQPQEETAEAE